MRCRAASLNRREFITVIDTEPVESIRDLARRVVRDKGDVKRDLYGLVDENLVTFKPNGRAKRPFVEPDTIVQEPLVTSAVVTE